MHVKIAMADLKPAVRELKHHIGGAKGMPILNHVKATLGPNLLTLMATSGDMACALDLPTKEQSGGDKVGIMIPHATLENICKLKDATTVELATVDGENMLLRAADLAITVKTMPADDFPTAFDPLPLQLSTEFEAEALYAAMASVAHAAGADPIRPILASVYLQQQKSGHHFRAVATDTHRLALYDILATHVAGEFAKNEDGFLLPIAVAKAILRYAAPRGSMRVHLAKGAARTLIVAGSGWRIQARAVEGRYPTYQAVLPSESDCKRSFQCRAADLQRAVSMVSQFCNKRAAFAGVKLAVNGSTLVVSVADSQAADAAKEIDIVSSNMAQDTLVVGYNPQYLLDAIASILSLSREKAKCRLTMRLSDETSPSILQSERGGACVVMPMRI